VISNNAIGDIIVFRVSRVSCFTAKIYLINNDFRLYLVNLCNFF